ncbi:MAG: phosphatase PAP2 family protein [Planctomycetota bacterium]
MFASLIAGLALWVVLLNDTELLRLYRNITLPAWLWLIEDVLSRHAHHMMYVVATILILFVPAASRRPGRERQMTEESHQPESGADVPDPQDAHAGLQHQLRLLMYGGVTIGIASLVTHVLKPTVGRVRPCDSGGDGLLFMPFNGLHVAFPSGHATMMFAVAFVLSRWRPVLAPLWFLLALAVAWARVHTDAHYLGDLLAALIICFAADRVAWSLVRPFGFGPGGRVRDIRRTLLIAAMWIALGVFTPVIATVPWQTPAAPLDAIASDLNAGSDRDTVTPATVIVRAAYQRVLQREADPIGLDAWVEHLDKKQVPAELVKSMATSTEFRRKLAEQFPNDPNGLVQEVYRRLLGRTASPAELDEASHVVGMPDPDRGTNDRSDHRDVDSAPGYTYARGLDNLVLRLMVSD